MSRRRSMATLLPVPVGVDHLHIQGAARQPLERGAHVPAERLVKLRRGDAKEPHAHRDRPRPKAQKSAHARLLQGITVNDPVDIDSQNQIPHISPAAEQFRHILYRVGRAPARCAWDSRDNCTSVTVSPLALRYGKPLKQITLGLSPEGEGTYATLSGLLR